MIELLQTSTTDQVEIRFSGQVTQSDYEAVLVPAIEQALAEHDQVRVLAILDKDFQGFDMGAMWADTQLGLSHWRGFDRVAIATDTKWVQVGARAVAPFAPCPARVFAASETDSARLWLRESLGTLQTTDLGGYAIELKLLGKLDPDAFAKADETLAAHISDRGALSLLLDLREFDGWQGLSALSAHFRVVRANVGMARRIAIVGDSAWQHMAQRAAGQILRAETRFFDKDDYADAKDWVTEQV